MMSDIHEEPACKQLRLSPNSAKDTTIKNDVQSKALDLTSAQTALSTIHLKEDINLSMIKFVKVLQDCPDQKKIHIQGEYGGQKVVLLLEKTPFSSEIMEKIISTTGKSLQKDFANDIYGNYTAFPPPELNGIKAVIIHPATEQHIQKYSQQDFRLIHESPEDYKNITLPYIESKQFTLDWVYNILNHQSEADRIIFEDPDPENGFILVPDLMWDGQQMSNLHLLAIVHQRGIKSLRDLNAAHLAMLKSIKNNCLAAISTKYGIKPSQIRSFLHYQPSFYHLHVHFQLISFKEVGLERCHVLENVIQNLTIQGDYYQRVTLTFPMEEKSELLAKYRSLKGEESL